MGNRVLTYSVLTTMVRRVAQDMDIQVDVYDGGILRGGVAYAQTHQRDYEVIISNGGTVEVIRQSVETPVVSIETSFIDVLDAVFEARRYNNRIGLIAYKSEDLIQLYNLKEEIGVDIDLFAYRSREEMQAMIDRACEQGNITLVSQDQCVSQKTADHKNINTVIIPCRERNVRNALLNAVHLMQVAKDEAIRAERFRAIINHAGDGIISFDAQGVLQSINPAAERKLRMRAADLLGKPLGELPDLLRTLYGDGGHRLNELIARADLQFVINRIPILADGSVTGVLLNFQEISAIQKLEQELRIGLHKKGLIAKHHFRDILGDSPEIRTAIEKARLIAGKQSAILIMAETGCGKELFAQSIHNASERGSGPFVALNCAALPEALMESELFGYEDGAFTGAKKGGKKGMFELAHGGTIFLDEVGEIPLALQGRLLRVLQEKEILRVGGNSVIHVDIRVIAATNLNLYKKVQTGEFRADLFFRLNVLDLHLPPLRERRSDILTLLRHFLARSGRQSLMDRLDDETIRWLEEYPWPGNIRELINTAEKLDTFLAEKERITLDDVRGIFSLQLLDGLAPPAAGSDTPPPGEIRVELGELREMERQIIEQALKTFRGDRTALAEKLGISRTTLWKKLKAQEDAPE